MTKSYSSNSTAPTGQRLNELSHKITGLLGLLFNEKLCVYTTSISNSTNQFSGKPKRHEAGDIGGIATFGLWLGLKESVDA